MLTIILKNLNAAGGFFPDGQYTLQVTPLFVVSEADRKEMRRLSDQNDHRGLVEYRKKLNIPEDVQFYNLNFRIEEGKFVFPYLNEESLKKPMLATGGNGPYNKHLGLYASIEEKANYGLGLTTRAWDNTRVVDDQVILDDLIIDGSLCVGMDCVNGESFGFDTQRFKENNLRIKFQDTSNSASFPTNDWQITANDSANGGVNKFSIDDVDSGRTPFTIEAGAPSHSLYVDDGGRIGFGTSTPVVEIHSKNGDSPTLRLEQDGSSGFTPQTWDIAGNETNFFVRDATNGSKLPFKIRPNAPTNSLFVDTDGDVGLGTASPAAKLDISGTSAMKLPLGTTAEQPGGVEGMLRGNSTTNLPEYFDGSSWLQLGAAAASNWSSSGGNVFRSSGNVGIGTASPTEKLSVVGNIKLDQAAGTTRFLITNEDATGTGKVVVQAGKGSSGFGGAINLFSHSHPTKPGWVTAGLSVGAGSGATEGRFTVNSQGLAGGTDVFTVLRSGNVGIGTTAPSFKLEVCGTIGTTAASVTTGIVCSSDIRFKKNVSPLEGVLQKVLRLQGVHYDWRINEFPEKHFNEGRQIGFIAQEMEKIYPEVVKTEPDGYKSLDYSRLTPILVEAIKEQQNIIDSQQAEIRGLQNSVADLKDLKEQVAQLRQLVQSAVGSGQGSVGSRQSAVGSRQGSVGSRQSAVGSGQGSVSARD